MNLAMELAMQEKQNSQEQVAAFAQKQYIAPTLIVLGSLREETEAGPGGLTDAGIFS